MHRATASSCTRYRPLCLQMIAASGEDEDGVGDGDGALESLRTGE